MGTIIPLHDKAHEQAQQLLPWYVNDTLGESERAQVEAHLAACDECRDDLATERVIGTRVTGAAPDVEQGWADMQARMRTAGERERRAFFRRRVPVGWVVGAQAVAAALIVAVMLPGQPAPKPTADYHALGSAPRPAEAMGNVIVMFAERSSEADLRGAFERSGARVVDGPTAAGAWVVHVDQPGRDRALATLRADAHVTLAEPIDPAGPQ